jgi:indole-3-acetate monooxygenase
VRTLFTLGGTVYHSTVLRYEPSRRGSNCSPRLGRLTLYSAKDYESDVQSQTQNTRSNQVGDGPSATPASFDAVTVARSLQSIIRTHADETERGRRLAAPVVDALRSSGLFSMGLASAMGGLETPIGAALRAIEEISFADGASGWNVMIVFDTDLWAGFLSGASRDLIGAIARPIVTGTLSSPGRIEKSDGGYRISGRWKFGSGCQHSDVVLVGALLCESGKPVLGPSGAPEMLQIALRASEVNILDTWRVTGLRGTGSHDFAIDNLVVAAERALPLNITTPVEPGPLYAFPMLASFAVAKGAVALGIARHAIDAFKEIARSKVPATRTNTLRERPAAQIDLAHAEALVHSARAFLYQSVEEGWRELIAGNLISQQLRALIRLAATDCVQRCAQAVDLMYQAAAATAIYESCELERCFRDAHVVNAHIVVQPAMYEAVGRVLLDLPPNTAVW